MRDHLTEGLAWLAKGAEQAEAPEKSSSSEIQDSHEANDGDVSASKAHALAATAAPALAGKDPIVPPADQIVRALGPNALQMEGKDGKPGGVVISDIPLAVPDPDAEDGGDWQPADLTFKTQGSRLVATRSLVATSVPDAADGTFRVGPLGVKLAPEGSDSTATSYDTSVIHPNIATDTDLATRSVGSGLKFGWVLRSPDAAQTQRAKLDLPPGADATLLDGGAVRIKDEKGNQIGTVSSAAATDADGISVPLETSLEGGTVSYRLKTDLAKVKTPVVIDPEMLYEWGTTGDTDIDGWVYNENATPFSGTIIANDGMRIKGEPGTGYGSQTWGGYIHWAPGDPSFGTVSSVSGQVASPEHGFFWKAEFGGLDYAVTAPYTQQDPNVNIGVLSSTDVNHPPTQRYQKQNATGGWNAPVASNLRQIPTGTLGATYRVYVGTDSTTPPTGGTNAKPDAVFSAVLYDFGLNGASSIARPRSEMKIAWTKLWAADNVNPIIATATPNTIGTTGWLGLTSNISTIASDRGTGIEKVEIYDQANATLYSPGVAKTCVATGKILCPFSFDDTVPVAPVPEGIGNYTMRATDGGGRTGTKPVALKVDKTPPTISLSGDLYTQRDTEIPVAAHRSITVDATDGTLGGTAGQQRSGVAKIRILVNDQEVYDKEQTVSGDSRPLSGSWTSELSTFSEGGEFQIDVEVTDRLGHVSHEYFNVTSPEQPLPPLANDGVGDPGYYSFIGSGDNPDAKVNIASGNLLVTGHDIADSDTTGHVVVDRYYNSLSPDAYGAASPRWSFGFGPTTKVAEAVDGTLTVHGPSGYTADGYPRVFDAPTGAIDTTNGLRLGIFQTATGWTAQQYDDDATLTFDVNGELTGVLDSFDRPFAVAYDEVGGHTLLTNYGPTGGSGATFAYHSNGMVNTLTDPASGVRTYGYAGGRLASVTIPGVGTTTYAYDSNGFLNGVTRPDGSSVATTNLPNGKVATFTEHDAASGPARTWQFDYSTPGETTVTLPDSTTKTYSYSGDGWILDEDEATEPDGATENPTEPTVPVAEPDFDSAEQELPYGRAYPVEDPDDPDNGAELVEEEPDGLAARGLPPLGRYFVKTAKKDWVTVRNTPGAFVVGNAHHGWGLNAVERQRKSYFGRMSRTFNGCGSIAAAKLSTRKPLEPGAKGCGRNRIPPTSIAKLVNCEKCNAGSSIKLLTSAQVYRNVRPWASDQDGHNKIVVIPGSDVKPGKLGKGVSVGWRYITRDGKWVLIESDMIRWEGRERTEANKTGSRWGFIEASHLIPSAQPDTYLCQGRKPIPARTKYHRKQGWPKVCMFDDPESN